ncbi:MAG TPA: aldehyde dehydrogenase family protein [Mycobacteriales bacterium]|nr:aldehyde dehydrogenase family protein [Mycobacteriales bacterium]
MSSPADQLIATHAQAAERALPELAAAPDEQIDAVLAGMGKRLESAAPELLQENAADVDAAHADGTTGALLDRLRLGPDRLASMAEQLRLLAAAPFPERDVPVRELPGGLQLSERRRPVGVIGANFEARPNVTLDMASQLLKSRNAGVLRTGSAALRSAAALLDHVIAPALSEAGLTTDAVQLVRAPGRELAAALVHQPGLIPLVIIRGSGQTTRALSSEAAQHGVRTLAHADGGGVLYVHAAADPQRASDLLAAGLDRLGVCNRVNLVLIDAAVYEPTLAAFTPVLQELGIAISAPPHQHDVGHEWALDTGNEATVTVAPVGGPLEAADTANRHTSGLAATVVTEEAAAATAFLDAYRGTGAFWNSSTRLLDGFKLTGYPETGINVDHVPGPRGPVTFRDLYLRQYVVVPR